MSNEKALVNRQLLILDDCVAKPKLTVPLSFWFNNTKTAGFSIQDHLVRKQREKEMFNKEAKEVCGCCDDSIYTILRDLNEIKETVTGNNKIILDAIISSRYTKDEFDEEEALCLIEEFDKISDELKELIEWCIDFLSIDRNEYSDIVLKRDQSNVHKNKYITLSSFVYDFLGIQQDSGYDYILMSLLEWYNIIEHGTSIRCAFFKKYGNNPYKDREITPERKDRIFEWIKNAPDDI